MECKEFEKQINNFIEKKLEYKELIQFVEHANTCADCREELTIQFLVREGLDRLEKGGAFDLQKELDECMIQAQKHIRMHKILKCVGITLEIVAVLAVVAILFLVIV